MVSWNWIILNGTLIDESNKIEGLVKKAIIISCLRGASNRPRGAKDAGNRGIT